MPLPRDPDVLRVPAFMRKRNLCVRAKRPLVLTAFDRKQAGEVLPELKKPAKKKPRTIAKVRRQPMPKKTETFSTPLFSAPMLDFFAEESPGPSFDKFRMTSAKPKSKSIPRPKTKSIGTLTHYYDKIKVGVIKLIGTLSVGDCIKYETDEGPYSQIVESMEINREPAFKAGRGKEVGLKLRKMPRVGTPVIMVK